MRVVNKVLLKVIKSIKKGGGLPKFAKISRGLTYNEDWFYDLIVFDVSLRNHCNISERDRKVLSIIGNLIYIKTNTSSTKIDVLEHWLDI